MTLSSVELVASKTLGDEAQGVQWSQELDDQPLEMDIVSIIATFPSEIREEVVLTGKYVAKANMLRERFARRYRTLFEPVNDEDNIIKLCQESNVPVDLDETIDNLEEHPLQTLARFTHNGIVAVVIKPSFVGGFEKAALIAK
ncbi:protein PHYLLO, chloroplastic isoform X1 [Tanacetum coccineum]